MKASSRWPLVIAANRDEFFDRPALALARWQTPAGQEVISGRDQRAGGTWLGLTPGGRLAMLTNVRERVSPPALKSRGELVMRWLEGRLDARDFMASVDCADYGGFNLVTGDFQRDSWNWMSNRTFEQEGHAHPHRPRPANWCWKALRPGIYGLSNASLDTPWPKTTGIKTALQAAMGLKDENSMRIALWSALGNCERAGDAALPDTGLPRPLERALSSAFIEDAARAYGTRSSAVLVATQVGIQDSRRWTLSLSEKTHTLASIETRGASHDMILATSATVRIDWASP